MSGLAALLAEHNPPDLYQWHSAAHVEDVQHAVEHAGWTFCYLDGWTTEDPESFCKGIDASLGLPDGSAAADLTSALSAVTCSGKGTVLLWDGWSPLARHDEAYFSQIRDAMAARTRSEGHDKLAIILRGEGPALDLEELPLKH